MANTKPKFQLTAWDHSKGEPSMVGNHHNISKKQLDALKSKYESDGYEVLYWGLHD